MLSFDPFDSMMDKERDIGGDTYIMQGDKETGKQND